MGPLHLVGLPDEILLRMLFLAFHSHRGVQKTGIIELLCTCKSLHARFGGILFTLRPIVLKNSSLPDTIFGPKSARRRPPQSSHLSESDIQRLFNSKQLMLSVRVANVLTSSRLVGSLGPSTVSSVSHVFSYNEHDTLLESSLPSFVRLHTLVISGRCLKPLSFLFNAPRSLKNFGLIFENRGGLFKGSFSQQAALFLEKVAEKNPFCFELQGFKVACDRPISHSSIHPILMSSRARRATDLYSEYYRSRRVLRFENRNLERKSALLKFGLLLYRMVDVFRETLTLIETEKVDLALVFSPFLMQKVQQNYALAASQLHLHGFKAYDYRFPCLKMLVADNASYTRTEAWMALLQQANLDVRQGHHLVVALHNSISRLLMVKLAKKRVVGEEEEEDVEEEIRWHYLPDPEAVLGRMKARLGVWR